jgi:P4 family phage/plasmid primase-like protien
MNATDVSTPSTGVYDSKASDLDYYRIAQVLIAEYHIITFKGTMFLYDEGFYREDSGTIDKAIIHHLLQCGLGGKASFTNPTSQINHIITSLTTEPDYPFNKQPYLIPVKNGVIKIDNKGCVELFDHSPEYMFTYQLPTNYNPNADIKQVVDYLASTGCDRNILLQLPAQTILSKWGRIYKKCYLLKGQKNSGKTTFLKMLNMRFFGKDNCSNIALQDLVNEKHSLSGIVGKLVNISDDLPRIKLDDVGQFKALTGGGIISINRKYHDPYSYENDTTFIFAANEYPPVTQDDPAYWERWCLIEFNKAYGIDPMFEERTFDDEFMSGFLNLVIERMQAIMKYGIISDPFTVTREKWLNDSDPFYRYIHTRLERDVESFIVTADLYNHYLNQCKVSNIVPFPVEKFGSKIQDFGGVKRQKKVDGKTKWGYQGFRIPESQDIMIDSALKSLS